MESENASGKKKGQHRVGKPVPLVLEKKHLHTIKKSK